MKKKSILLILLMSFFMMLNAQNKETLDYKNNIQFNPLNALLFGSFEFQYERAVSDESTVSLTLGLKLSSQLFKISGLDSPILKTDDFGFTGFTITPEYRWYFQKNVTKRTGLYLGGYYKFKNVGDNIKGTYTSLNTNTTYPIQVDVNMQAHTLGALLGYKVMISKNLYIDIIIAGPGYSSIQLKIKEEQPLPKEFYTDVASEIVDNFNIVSNFIGDVKIKKTNSDGGGDSFGLPAFRYGFKIGYSF